MKTRCPKGPDHESGVVAGGAQNQLGAVPLERHDTNVLTREDPAMWELDLNITPRLSPGLTGTKVCRELLASCVQFSGLYRSAVAAVDDDLGCKGSDICA